MFLNRCKYTGEFKMLNDMTFIFSATTSFLVQYQERKRVVTARPRDLPEACGVAFNLLTNFTLEVWNTDWDSWIVFCPDQQLPNKPKVRIVEHDTVPQGIFFVEP